jgi:hypothetical protein
MFGVRYLNFNARDVVVIQTVAASRNKHVAAVCKVLHQHGVRFHGQYRGDAAYAVVASNGSIPAECRAAILALPLPKSAKIGNA